MEDLDSVLGSDRSAFPTHLVVEVQKQVGEGLWQSSHLHRVDLDVRRHSVRGVGPNVGDRPCEGKIKNQVLKEFFTSGFVLASAPTRYNWLR